MNRRWIFPLLIVLFCIPLMIPFLKSGYFPTHDGEWAIVRLAEMHREIKDGQIPPRWAGYLNHGYGYPLFLFTYPFPYYAGELFYLIGFGLTTSIKILFILSILGSALAMYLLGQTIYGKWGGLASSILYIYAPYRMVNLYVRGSLGESLALIFFPLLFWLFYKLIYDNSRLIVLIPILLAAFILTHNAMVVLFMPILCLWILWHLYQVKFDRSVVFRVLIYIELGILLSAYFWLPAIIEKSYIALSQVPLANISENFVSLGELFSNKWYFGIRPPLQVGMIQIIIFCIICLLYILNIKKDKNRKMVIFFGLITSIVFSLLFPISSLVWKLPLLKEIDFPWRILATLTFLLAFIGGGLKIATNKCLMIVGLILAVGFNYQFIQTQSRLNKADDYYETNDATTTSADELMPIWVTDKLRNRPQNKIEVYSQVTSLSPPIPEGNIWKLMNDKSQSLDLEINSTQPLLVKINTLFFPGWSLKIDGKKEQLTSATELITFTVPSGNHNINLYFARTPVRWIADIISLIGLTGLIWVIWKKPKILFH